VNAPQSPHITEAPTTKQVTRLTSISPHRGSRPRRKRHGPVGRRAVHRRRARLGLGHVAHLQLRRNCYRTCWAMTSVCTAVLRRQTKRLHHARRRPPRDSVVGRSRASREAPRACSSRRRLRHRTGAHGRPGPWRAHERVRRYLRSCVGTRVLACCCFKRDVRAVLGLPACPARRGEIASAKE
jgi:hypothetical protein